MSVYEKARARMDHKIREAFWQLYEQKPIEHITVAAVSQIANVHRSTFYLHFTDVYQVLEKIEDQLLAEIKNSDTQLGRSTDGLTKLGQQLFTAVRDNYRYLKLLLIEQRDPQFARRYREFFQARIVQVIQGNGQNNSVEQEMAKQLIARLLVESFITCAGNPQIDFATTEKFMQGTIQDGYYETLNRRFQLNNLINPFAK